MLATGHYIERRDSARRPRACSRPPIPSATRAISCSPPRTQQLALAALPARRHAQGARCASSRARFGLPVADKSDSQDICFVPTGPLHGRHRAPEAGRAEARRHRARRRPRARPPRRHHQLHGRPAPRHRNPGRRAALRRPPRCRDATRSWSGPRDALAHALARRLGTSIGWATSRSREAARRLAAARADAIVAAAAACDRVRRGGRRAGSCCTTARTGSRRGRRACFMPSGVTAARVLGRRMDCADDRPRERRR